MLSFPSRWQIFGHRQDIANGFGSSNTQNSTDLSCAPRYTWETVIRIVTTPCLDGQDRSPIDVAHVPHLHRLVLIVILNDTEHINP